MVVNARQTVRWVCFYLYVWMCPHVVSTRRTQGAPITCCSYQEMHIRLPLKVSLADIPYHLYTQNTHFTFQRMYSWFPLPNPSTYGVSHKHTIPQAHTDKGKMTNQPPLYKIVFLFRRFNTLSIFLTFFHYLLERFHCQVMVTSWGHFFQHGCLCLLQSFCFISRCQLRCTVVWLLLRL